jgi:hypothetical protein
MKKFTTLFKSKLLSAILLLITFVVQAQTGNVNHNPKLLIGSKNYDSNGKTLILPMDTIQEIYIERPGWYGISLYLDMTGIPVSEVMAPVADELFAIIDEDGNAYIPSMFVNTIGNWEAKGYKALFTEPCVLAFNGSQLTEPTFTVEGSFTYFPVFSDSTIPIIDLFANHLNDIQFICDWETQDIWYGPEIFSGSFQYLEPGNAYLLVTTNANTSFTIQYNGATNDGSSRKTDVVMNTKQNINNQKQPSLEIPWVNIKPSALTICQGECLELSGLVEAGNFTDVFWFTTNGCGFFNDNVLEPMYCPGYGDYTQEFIEIYVYVSDGISAYSFDQIALSISEPPTVYAGEGGAIACESYYTDDAYASNWETALWVTNGSGNFSDPSSLLTYYYPGEEDYQQGFVTLELRVTPISPCTWEASSQLDLYLQSPPTVYAGPDVMSCRDVYYNFNASADNFASLQWYTPDGTGFFWDAASLNPYYFPSPADFQQGCVTLVLMAEPVEPCAVMIEDEMILCFLDVLEVWAGDDTTICEDGNYQLSGGENNAEMISWFTSGDGMFSDPGIPNPVYIPGANDLLSGQVELTLTAIIQSSCYTEASDAMLLTIQKAPTPYAGMDATICQDNYYQLNGNASNYYGLLWETSGDGYFNNFDILNPVYTPGNSDISIGEVYLTMTAIAISPCEVTASDELKLQIQPLPSVNIIPAERTICYGEVCDFSGLVVAGNYNQIQWFTYNGTGFFNNETILEPVYYPTHIDYVQGCILIGVAVQSINPCTINPYDYITLCFQKKPTASAGNNVSICQTENYTLNGATASYYSLIIWTTSGDGFFDDPSKQKPTYTPGAADIASGLTTLTISAQPVTGCSFVAISSMVLSINKQATADAGFDATFCANLPISEIQLNGTVSNGSSLLWSSNGNGIFNNVGIEDPVYYPGDLDFHNEGVTLSIYVQPLQPCMLVATDQVIFSILQKAEANIPAGWSGISSYIQPADANIETVMTDVLSELIIMYNYDKQIYYPAYNINTLNNWDTQKGYFIKVNDDATLNICGSKAGNLTLNLTAGWNIIPVLSSQDVPVTDVFAPLGSILTIIKEVAGYHIYYPEYGIYTLNSLMSGKAYLVRVTEDCSITFPEVVNKSGVVNPPSNFDGSDIWGEVIPTPSSHQIIFPVAITISLNQGDVIGAFAADGLCAGMLLIDGSQSAGALTVYGDDAYTSASDGLMEGQMMSFKLFKTETSTEFDFQLQFDQSMNDGHFANNGISLVKAMNLLTVNEINSAVPNIYPNPAKNCVTIEFEGLTNGAFNVEMMNAFGEVVKRGQSSETSANLDVSGLSRGVYYLRLTSGSQTFIEKLILQ